MRCLVLVVVFACGSQPVRPPAVTGTAPAWFLGAWKREWFIEDKNARQEPWIVRDLQTPTVFGSMRIPLDRPAFPDAKSFEDLDDKQLAILLEQRGGFAGTARFEGDRAYWTHEIDFRPPNGADEARLARLGPTTVLETSFDGTFSELWWSMSTGDGKYLGIRVTRNGRTEKILTVVGDHFVYARNRARDLPKAESLTALVAAQHATRAQIIEYLDCELSYGTIRSGRVPWEIRYSTLPWREGKTLDFAKDIVIDKAGAPAPRTPIGETWAVAVNTMVRDDLIALFP